MNGHERPYIRILFHTSFLYKCRRRGPNPEHFNKLGAWNMVLEYLQGVLNRVLWCQQSVYSARGSERIHRKRNMIVRGNGVTMWCISKRRGELIIFSSIWRNTTTELLGYCLRPESICWRCKCMLSRNSGIKDTSESAKRTNREADFRINWGLRCWWSLHISER